MTGRQRPGAPMPGLGGRLRAARIAADLTREELGRRVGTTARTIRRLEDEQRRVSEEELGRIAGACGAPVWFLERGWWGGTTDGPGGTLPG
jgi:transcriptional regulator with XRE-family HTH domain